jgi:transcriptional regulator with XRE-family HTH domain
MQNGSAICFRVFTLLETRKHYLLHCMPSTSSPAYARLLPRLRAWFSLSQNDLGQCLGLSHNMVSQVELGLRNLPLRATMAQAAFTLAYQQTVAGPEPAPEAPDVAALHYRLRACQLRADQVAAELREMSARATWARRRLMALPALTAALTAAGTPPPAWLTGFAAEANAELARSGSTAQALLRLRYVALVAEADEAARVLAEVGIAP